MDPDAEQAMVLQFQEVCGIEDEAISREFLQRFEWNLDRAVQEFLNAIDPHPEPNDELVQPPPLIDDAPGSSRDLTNQLRHRHGVGDSNDPLGGGGVPIPPRLRERFEPAARMGWLQWSSALLALPFRFVTSSLWDLLQFISRLFFPVRHHAVTDATGDVTSFLASFEQRYAAHPTFYRGTYSAALDLVKRELRFLLVYLHSDGHQDTDRFCRDTLGNADLIQFVNANMLFWSASVRTQEGARVSLAMRETTYPFVALICLREGRPMIVLRREGWVSAADLIALLAIAVQDNENYLNAARQEREQHQFNQLLRQQQEEAFEESLRTDRERDQQKRAEVARKQAEEQERVEHALAKERKAQELQQRRERVRESLPDEPQAGADTIRVSLKFPSGARLERRFLPDHSLELLYKFAFSHEDCPSDFSIMTSYPRKTLECPHFSWMTGAAGEVSGPCPTFVESGLDKAVMLVVRDNEA